MKHFFTFMILLLIIFVSQSKGQVLESFEAGVDTTFTINIETGASSVTLTNDNVDFTEGTGSLKADVIIGAINQWGSFAHLEKNIPEGTVLDWAGYDTLTISLKVHEAPTLPDNWLFRMHIQDQPSPDVDVEEYIYENVDVLDAVTDGWVDLKIPLIDRDLDGEGLPNAEGFSFIPAAWYAGSTNNNKIDWDSIVYWTITFVTAGWDPAAPLPADSAVVSFDNYRFTSLRKIPFVLFNGKTVNSDLTQFTWGQSALEVEEGAGATPSTHALKWTQGDEWAVGATGAGWNIAPFFNMQAVWPDDNLSFKMKAEDGVGDILAQFEDPDGNKVGTIFTPTADNEWHDYELKLSEMTVKEGGAIDPSRVSVFQFMAANGSAVAGKVIYIDDLWTGNPEIDIVAPGQVASPLVTKGDYQNVITWVDVPGEVDEFYNVYYSTSPITSTAKGATTMNDTGIEVVASNIPGGEQIVDHLLIYPAVDTDVQYYYAIECMDAAGNYGELVDAGMVTNTAKGVTTIHPEAPVSFAADGDLSEWANITPFRIFPDDGSGFVVTNKQVDNDADLSVLAYVAVDAEFLYVAFDVEDNVVYTDPDKSSYLIDAADLFIGLYDWHGKSHTPYKRGAEPDYHFRFGYKGIIVDNISGAVWVGVDNENYYWDVDFPTGYTVEAKISLADLAAYGSDEVFSPQVGMRTPIDFQITDADDTGELEGILTYSKFNEDQSFADVSRWAYTWIGNEIAVGVEDELNSLPLSYSLEQNYPNPFNPNTTIRFNIAESGPVTLKVYNLLGQQVATLVNEVKNVGNYEITFDARNLASGIYIYQIISNNFINSKKMILLK